jgi:hypothetical protein
MSTLMDVTTGDRLNHLHESDRKWHLPAPFPPA